MGPGFTYATHRQPTITDALVETFAPGIRWMRHDRGYQGSAYHYSLLPKPAAPKSADYASASRPIGQVPGNGLTRCTADWNIHIGSTTSMRIRAGWRGMPGHIRSRSLA